MKLLQEIKHYPYGSTGNGFLVAEYFDDKNRLCYRECLCTTPIFDLKHPHYLAYEKCRLGEKLIKFVKEMSCVEHIR